MLIFLVMTPPMKRYSWRSGFDYDNTCETFFKQIRGLNFASTLTYRLMENIPENGFLLDM